MKIAHLVNCPRFTKTGYSVFVYEKIPELFLDFSNFYINVNSIAAPFYENNNVLAECYTNDENLNKLFECTIEYLEGFEYVFIHMPVLLPSILMKYINDRSKNKPNSVITIIHDLQPFTSHNGFWNMQPYNVENCIIALKEFKNNPRSINIDKVFNENNFWNFYTTLFNLEPLTISEKTKYFRYCIDLAKTLEKTKIIAPSPFIENNLKHLISSKIHVIPHPKDNNRKNSKVLSLFGWEKFNPVFYLMVVNSMPDVTFDLLVDKRMYTTYLEPLFHGYGKPKNLNILDIMPREDFVKILPQYMVFFHQSWIQESYGMLVDDCLSAGLPIVAVANEGGFSSRISYININKGYEHAYKETLNKLKNVIAKSKPKPRSYQEKVMEH